MSLNHVYWLFLKATIEYLLLFSTHLLQNEFIWLLKVVKAWHLVVNSKTAVSQYQPAIGWIINWRWSIAYPHRPIHNNGLTSFSLLNEIILDPLSFSWLHCLAVVEFTLPPPHSNVSFVFFYMLFHQQRPKGNNRVWAFSGNANKKLTVVMVNSESSGRIFDNILQRLVFCVWLCSCVWNTCTHMFSLTHIIIGRNRPATCRCLDLAAKQKSLISFLIHI